MILKNISNLLYKIELNLNKIRFTSNSNLKIGKNLKLGNHTYHLIHETSNAIIGNNVDIRNSFNLVLAKNANLVIKDNVFFNNLCSLNCLEKILIGENSLFGENVKIYDHNHLYDIDKVYHKEFSTSPITIGKNCWLGSNVIVLKGVNIGDNVIIGAGCVIHKDVPSNSIILNKEEQIIKSL